MHCTSIWRSCVPWIISTCSKEMTYAKMAGGQERVMAELQTFNISTYLY